jgi:hypothetical protein
MNVPNINIKEILAKLSVLKNNMSLLVPIIIAVVGLLLVVPTRILSARLRGAVEKTSVTDGKDIERITRELAPENLKPLSQKQLDAMAQDANQIEQLMEQAGKRELLSYDLFPDTNDQSRELFTQFGQRYRQGIATLVKSLNPGECPTTTEIQTALSNAPRPLDATGGGYGYGVPSFGMGNASYQGAGMTLDSLTDAQRNIVDQLCLGKARGARIYAALSDVSGYTYWGNWTFENRDKAYQDCWYWQLGYWVIEDVVATIQQMNGSAENVVTAPVKRLMNVSFAFRRPTYGMQGAYGGGGSGLGTRTEGERPVYVTGPTSGLTTPCTGRICNENADVIHFDVQVVVDATQVMPFMQALCTAKEHRYRGSQGNEPEQKFQHNQITILETSVKPIEPKDVTHLLYRYGDREVTELELICEYMFCRTPAYQGIKPPQARKDLGETVEGAAAGTTP